LRRGAAMVEATAATIAMAAAATSERAGVMVVGQDTGVGIAVTRYSIGRESAR
jgi:hypothetical protein